ncbi:hypothetical protein MMC13_001633 [Lambiella insularis]|nr:hypothetical protein [Lambiella insularis]
MVVDPLSPVAPARIRCLLLPSGKITRSRFLTFVERLQQELTVRLGDVSPNTQPHRNMFSPLAFPTGFAMFNMTTAAPSGSHSALSPFELYREPLVIVGISDGAEYFPVDSTNNQSSDSNDGFRALNEQDTRNELSEAIMWLKEQHPLALVHQIMVFDCNERDIQLTRDVVLVPTLEKSKTTTMKTIMCDLTSLLLGEMTSYAKSLQALPSIETPKLDQDQRASDDKSVPDSYYDGGSRPESRPESRIFRGPTSRPSSPAGDTERSQNRGSVRTQMTSTMLDDGDDRSRSRPRSNGHRTPPVTFDQMNGMPDTPAFATDKDKARRSSRDRVPVQGFGSGSVGDRAHNKVKGRKRVVLGSLYLLAGRWPDALKELIEGATITRSVSDHVWHAKALDYILVCLLICAWAGMDFEVPHVCYPLGEKSSPGLGKPSKITHTTSMSDVTPLKSPNPANRLVSLQNLCTLLPDLINNILHLYVRAATFTADQLPQISYSESAIRFAKLLTIIEIAHGLLDDLSLQLVVLNIEVTTKTSTIPSHFASFPTRAEIAAVLFRALPSPAMERSLDTRDRVSILTGIASVLARLDFHRKKGFIIRELVVLLLPALIQSRKDSAAELGVHPAANVSLYNLLKSDSSLGEEFGSSHSPGSGLQGILSLMCEVYGVVVPESAGTMSNRHSKSWKNDDSSSYNEDTASNFSEVVAMGALKDAITRSFGDESLKVDVLRSCINLCEAQPDFDGIVRFSSEFLRTTGSGAAPILGSHDGSPNLPMEDQLRLLNNISRTINAARKLGFGTVDVDYWDDFLVRDLQITNSSAIESPSLNARARLNSTPLGLETKEGPFIYNPFGTKASSDTAKPILIVGEEATFLVLLQNLYGFDLEIEWIKLSSSEMTIPTLLRNVVIGPFRTQSFYLVGTPRASGTLRITGCIAKIRGCRERQFPIFKDDWKYVGEAKLKYLGLSAAAITSGRPKPSVPDSVQTIPPSSAQPPAATTLDVKVIDAQPNVAIEKTSLPQSAIMLLEGETRTFTITLRNISTTNVNLLLFAYTDSTLSNLQSALANKNLPQAELYEIELTALNKEAFRWPRQDSSSTFSIAPNSNLTLEMEVLGKAGLTTGTLHFDYGYLDPANTESKDDFFTRQISTHFTITVNSSVDLVHNIFLPFTGDFAWLNQQRQFTVTGSAHSTPPDRRSRATSRLTPKAENRFQSLFDRLGLGTQGSDHFVLLLDFHNAWPRPLSISVQVRQKTTPQNPSPSDLWKRAYTVHEVLQPSQTSRLVLLLPRFSLPNPYMPIPSLNPATKRQFIHSSGTVQDKESERDSREAFWLREEILKLMRASWTEDTSGRSGQIDLRSLQLTPRVIETIKHEEVGIDVAVGTDNNIEPEQLDHPTVIQTARSNFRVLVDAFVSLTTTVTNRLQIPIYPLLRVQPSIRNQPHNIALDLSRRFAFNGLTQQTMPILQPGESKEVQIGAVFLCTGEFEIRASVEELRIWQGKSGNTELSESVRNSADSLDPEVARLLKRTERRVWHSRESCAVHVVDREDEEYE